MSDKSAIQWTDATCNPLTGCTEISPGCDHCYARTFAERFRGVSGHPYEQGFDLKLWPARLELPFRWKSPRYVFVNSMSDRDAIEQDLSLIRQLSHSGTSPKAISRQLGYSECVVRAALTSKVPDTIE